MNDGSGKPSGAPTNNEPLPFPRPANMGMMVAAGVLLALPVLVLAIVPLYAKDQPEFAGWPFFFWFQMACVPVCALMTYAAHRLVLAARGQKDRDEPEERS